MNTLVALIKRNCKLFFKDKGMFFTSMVTPMILLILYVTFLGNVYRDSFADALPEGVTVADEVINGLVGGELFSSLLAVCCVTVAFCSNMLMVQDKVSGAGNDLMIAPVRPSILALGYYIACRGSRRISLSSECRMVSAYLGCILHSCRCISACDVWYGSVQHRQFLSLVPGADLRCGHGDQRRLWLYLRRIYAYFKFWRGTAEGIIFSARDVWYVADP